MKGPASQTARPLQASPDTPPWHGGEGESSAGPSALVDRFGRRITYLRLSLTDRCNFRCVYCMAEDQRFTPREQVLSLDELAELAAVFVALGVRKIRLTGGEPLVRPGAVDLMRRITALPGLMELVITTNGARLPELARDIRAAGVRRINISLDSLRPERFRAMTRNGDLARVLQGIDAALAAGFERIKLNVVVLKGRNHDEVLDLVRFAMDRGINISFIEEMPLGVIGDHDRAEAFYPSERIRAELAAAMTLVPTTESTGGPARYYRIPGSETRVGFISPHSHNFCGDCNRVRVTAEGLLLLCLGQEHSLDLRAVMRAHPGDTTRLRDAIVDAMQIKPEGHSFDLQAKPVIFRTMNKTGG
ncbi:GTP 3',8-cyclase MoaA [Thiohalocapsa marina]|uniref:GTP 3',8-cyclase n=1 Tax=Thiohalocapsa marina TaxID=424902 RepID=A0A5M8FE41_9GAMM|nr:GTP 3',8-cyclase MoaA [Thiohalocapsa marina]KAA6182919.1 GTP 3',8-cyclase MoaA [Thiohalocapsa marina]